MPNLLVELRLGPDADPAYLIESARKINKPALKVEGVIATRTLGGGDPKPDRLLLKMFGETIERALGLASFMREWEGVVRVEMAEIVDLEGAGSIGLLSGDEPKLPGP